MKQTEDNLKRYTWRVNSELLEKFSYIARSEDRSINQHLSSVIKRYVQKYEEVNGVISTSKNEEERSDK